MRSALMVLVTASVLAFFACGEEKKEAQAGGSPPADSSAAADEAEVEAPEAGDAEEAAPVAAGAKGEAEKIFAGRCFTCHGMKGEGDGPGSAALMPKPRNFTDAAWQASVTDDHLAKIIQYGGAAVGKSPTMPGNPDLMSKPEVVQALVAHIRSLSAAQ
jgi:mono/diheme cytochrome c family protein